MANRKQIIIILAIQIFFVHGGNLKRSFRDARLPEREKEHIIPEENLREVFYPSKPDMSIPRGDIGEPPPFYRKNFEENRSEEDSSEEEERFEKALLEQLSRLRSVELMRGAESIESARVKQVNDIRNIEGRPEVLPITPRPIKPEAGQSIKRPSRLPRPNRRTGEMPIMRPPVPVDERLPNGFYTDINRVEPINEYLLSREILPMAAQPIPAPEVPVQNGGIRKPVPIRGEVPPPIKEEVPPPKNEKPDLIRVLLDRIKPGENNLLGNRRWVVYLGHVLLHALTTLIDGTQVALKEYSGVAE